MGIFSRIFRRRRQGDASASLIGSTTSTIDEHDSSVTASPITETPPPASTVRSGSETSTIVESVGGAERVVNEFSLPDIDDADDLESTGLGTSYDASLTPEDVTASRIFQLMNKTANLVDRDRVIDRLVEIEVIGRLPGGWWAWVGPDDIWGVIDRDIRSGVSGEPWRIQAGDRIRVRVTWRPWYSVIENHDLVTLVRSDGERYFKKPTSTSPRKFESFLDALQTGDVVLAYVPYGPNNPIDQYGNLGKDRPVVFVGWTTDGFALVRGAYTAEPGRYINKLDAHVLRHPQGIFNKPRVAVKRTSVVIYPDTIQRRFGRLHDDDLRLIGIEPPRLTTSPSQETPETSHFNPPDDPVVGLPLLLRPYYRDLESRLSKLPAITVDEIGVSLLEDVANHRFPSLSGSSEAVPMTTLGQLMSILCSSLGIDSRPKPFLAWLQNLVESRPDLKLHIYSSSSKEGVTVLHDRQPVGFVLYSTDSTSTSTSATPVVRSVPDLTPLDSDSRTSLVRSNPSTVATYLDKFVDDWHDDDEATESNQLELKVRAVIIDQLWTHKILGDRRVDLAQVRKDFTLEDPEVAAWIVAPNLAPLHGFLHRAKQCGWKVKTLPGQDRTGLEETIGEILDELEPGIVVLISNYSDFVGAVENLGWDCIVDSDFMQYAI